MKTTQKSPEAGSSPPVKQLLDEPETVTIIDTGYRYDLYNVACLSDEEFWTSGHDKSMKLYSINRGSLLKSIKTKSGEILSNITVLKGKELVYIDFDDRTVNIVKNAKIEELIRLQNWRPSGVCSTFSGDLLVIMNQPFSPRGITTDSQSHILTADGNNHCVHIIDQDGQFLCYIDCRMSKPWGQMTICLLRSMETH
ncbi:uncharacterized protein LOC134259195 [Saccostrea cucullata]|uniref:uncharacterized protein LOC134259195 n=1 Tax=Saccostrea cuccullata TaxID=36930 RepID=UPI002ECFCFAF